MAKNEHRSQEAIDGQLISTIAGNWQAVTKDADGNAHIHTLYKHSTKTRPLPDLEDLLVRQAPPVRITPSRAKVPERDFKLIVDLPDPQVDWRRLPSGELSPIHDERAMKIGRLICYDLRPDVIVIGGDALDMAAIARFDKDSQHFNAPEAIQVAIDGLSSYLAGLRSDNPKAEIVMLTGNHEQRLIKYVLKNAEKVYGLRRANSPEEWPVLTVPYLLRTDEMDIKWVSGYPANEYRYNDDLTFVHGDKTRSQGSSAELYSKEYDTNVVFHHVHRIESHTRTTKTGRFITAATFGTLASIRGDVPSYGSGVDDRGEIVPRYENWQQGLGLIAVYPDGYIEMHPIHIRNGMARFMGREYLVD